MKQYILIVSVLLSLSQIIMAQKVAQFRGPNRTGVFPDAGLLKSWPEGGPKLLWSVEGLGGGYASVSVTDRAVYVTGKDGSKEKLTVLDFTGKLLWKLSYGQTAKRSYNHARCTPTVEDDRIYLISGRGEVVCVDANKKQIHWSVSAFDKFEGEDWYWEISEQPLIVDNKIVFTPGGQKTSMVALDKFTGKTVWQTESLRDTTANVSPNLIEFEGNKIIVNVMINYIFGVDAKDGQILWKVKYSDIEPPTDHPAKPHNNCVMPLYNDGHLFVTSGYDHVGLMFKLTQGGSKIEQVWINRTLDNHHGQVVRFGNYIYGSNWINNRKGNWCSVNWHTGETMYEKEWHTKGPISAADGMLYCFEEKSGNLALVEATPNDFKVVSSFKITKGSGPFWAQPVIHNGVLYVRHGAVLMAYDIKNKS